MTPQPEPEYIIKESDIVHVENEFGTTLPVIFVKLFAKSRSRHAPTHGDCHYCTKCIESERAEAAAQAREKVLDALARDWKGRYVEDAVAEIRRFPESLRTGGEP